MGNFKEDSGRNFKTIFFVILFSFFALCFSDRSESRASSGYPSRNEQAFGNAFIHADADVFNVIHLPGLYKNYMSSLHNTSLNLFSLQYKIAGFDQKMTQNFIRIQKTRLIIEPLFLWRLFHTLSLSGKEDLPALR